MSNELVKFIVENIDPNSQVLDLSNNVDYDADYTYIKNVIINMEDVSSTPNILKAIELYNFSFINIKSKGNLKSLFKTLDEEKQTQLLEMMSNVVKETEMDRQTNKIAYKICEKDIKRKKNLKMIYNMFDIMQQIIEGTFKESRIKEVSEFIDAFYFDRTFLEDCVKQYNHIVQLKSGAQIDIEVIKKYFDTDFLSKVKYSLDKISTISFYNYKHFKYYNFQFVDDAGNKFTCKSGQIKNSGGVTVLPGWRMATIIFDIFENTKLFKTQLEKEILACKSNIYYSLCLLPQELKNNGTLKLAFKDLIQYVKGLKSFEKFQSELHPPTEDVKTNIPKVLELVRSLDNTVLNRVKTYVLDIMHIISSGHVKLPKDLETEMISFVENYDLNSNIDFTELLKLLNV